MFLLLILYIFMGFGLDYDILIDFFIKYKVPYNPIIPQKKY